MKRRSVAVLAVFSGLSAALAGSWPALAHACPSSVEPEEAWIFALLSAVAGLFVLSGLGFALYDLVMALRRKPLGRRVAIVQSAVMAGHIAASFWGTLATEGSDQLMLIGYLVFSCLIFVHAVGEVRAATPSLPQDPPVPAQ